MAVNVNTAPGENQLTAGLRRAGIVGGTTTPPIQQAAATASPAPQPDPQRNMNQNTQSDQSIDLRSLGRGMRSMMSRTRAGEALTSLAKALDEIYRESGDESFEYSLIQISKQSDPTLPVDLLILAVRDKKNLDIGVAFHTLLVEASADIPQPRIESIGGQNIEIMRVVGDAYDANMVAFVQHEMVKRYGQANLLDTMATVVPKDLKMDDKETLRALAGNTAFACSQELEVNAPGFRDVNLARARSSNNLMIRPLFNQESLTDVVGHPLRADIQIDFSAQPQNQQNNGSYERATTISRLSGFLDAYWDPAQPVHTQVWGQQAPAYQRYAMRFVATLLESQELLTISAQLLALLPALALRENNGWVQGLKAKPFDESSIDWTDIGAIGYEVNMQNNANGIGDFIDTKADSFKTEHLHKLIAMTFKPGLVLSLDVPEVGGSTWYNGVFPAAAEGNINAQNAIINAANELTNGNFGQHFPAGARVAIDENNRIHLGYFTDKKGVRQDLRKIDYLAVLNATGGRDLTPIKDWSDSFMRREYSIAQRLHQRKRIIGQMVTDPVFTGFARRVTFTPEFINALVEGCRAVGLAPRLAQNYQDLGSYERATGSYLGNVLMSSDPTGMFNRAGFGGGQTNAAGMRNFNGRW